MLTEKSLSMLAAVGANLSAERVTPTCEGVVEAVLQVAASPNARLVDATEVALDWLAKRDYLRTSDFAHADDTARRLVGYLAERRAETTTNPRVRKHLGTFAARMCTTTEREQGAPVWLLEVHSPRTLQRLLRQGNSLNQKWNVYG